MPRGRRPQKITPADFGKSMLPKMEASGHSEEALLLRTAVASVGKPGPMDPLDAEHIGRSVRASHALEDAGFPVASAGPHQRGVSIEHGDHLLSITPNAGRGHHVGISYLPKGDTAPGKVYGDTVHSANIDVSDPLRLPTELRVHLARPDVRAAMR